MIQSWLQGHVKHVYQGLLPVHLLDSKAYGPSCAWVIAAVSRLESPMRCQAGTCETAFSNACCCNVHLKHPEANEMTKIEEAHQKTTSDKGQLHLCCAWHIHKPWFTVHLKVLSCKGKCVITHIQNAWFSLHSLETTAPCHKTVAKQPQG